MTKNKILAQWEKATINRLNEFIRLYFIDENTRFEDVDYFWVGDHNDLENCLKYSPSVDQFFDWYYKRQEAYENKIPFPNLQNYLKLEGEIDETSM